MKQSNSIVREQGTSTTRVDIILYALFALFGVFCFKYYLRTPDIAFDSSYPDLAQSILQQHSYQFDFRPETTFPPGLPMILALVSSLAGFNQVVLFHTLAISAALGLLASYELLRRIEGRAVAAVACLLLASAPELFYLSTNVVFSDVTFLAISMLSLLLALELDIWHTARTRIGLILLFSLSLVLTVMIRSVGFAMVLAICAWIPVSFWRSKAVGRRRLILFLFPLILGGGVQLAWSEWANHRQFTEWALPGYPQSYVSQLRVKSGNVPELGWAHLSDLPTRVEQNLVDGSAGLAGVLVHKGAHPFWSSPAVIGVILLITLGLSSSLFQVGGGLHDWYFLIYETIYVLWPWKFELRFILPVIPLACLYLWRGAKVLARFSSQRQVAAGVCFLFGGLFLFLSSLHAGTQVKLSHRALAAGCWGLVALFGCGILALHFVRAPRLRDSISSPILRSRVQFAGKLAMISAFTLIVGYGIVQEVRQARRNLNFDIAKDDLYYPDIEAAEWIRANTPPDAVIIARKQDLVFHYSGHRVVWLPPISNPDVLMEGIRKYHVGLVVLADRDDIYWLPSNQDCVRSLLNAYGSSFHVLHHGPNNWVFAVQ